MKIALYISLIFSFSMLHANEMQMHFEQANSHYKNGEYKQAIEIYQQILKSGYESGELYFNTGNAFYKSGDLARARLFYEKSLLWLDGDEDVQQNINLVKLHLVDQIKPAPRLIIFEWWDQLLALFRVHNLGYFTLIVFWLSLVVVAMHLHFRKRGRIRYKKIMTASILILLLASTLWMSKIYQFETEAYGVILSSTVTIYASPAEESTELFVVHGGTKVKVGRSATGWYEIRLADGKKGWIIQSALEII